MYIVLALPPKLRSNQGQSSEEWEISKLLNQRPAAGGGRDYLVEWKSTWLHKCELGSALELIEEFKQQGKRGQIGHNGAGMKRGRR